MLISSKLTGFQSIFGPWNHLTNIKVEVHTAGVMVQHMWKEKS